MFFYLGDGACFLKMLPAVEQGGLPLDCSDGIVHKAGMKVRVASAGEEISHEAKR